MSIFSNEKLLDFNLNYPMIFFFQIDILAFRSFRNTIVYKKPLKWIMIDFNSQL